MQLTADEMQKQHRDNATHYRKGAIVYTVDGTLEFDGRPENGAFETIYTDSNYTKKRYNKKMSCVGRFYNNRGINAAKRYVRTNNLVSYNQD